MSAAPTARRAANSGNGLILGVARASDAWRVAFASEPRTSPQPLWFHIEVSDLGGAPVEFVWENPDITLGGRDSIHLLRPVLRADDGPWQRCGQVEIDEHDDGRKSLRFHHDGGADTVAAAFCFPYGPEHLDATLAELGGAWTRSPIGVTGGGRRIDRLRLQWEREARGPGLYLTARQHSGETPGSWVLDGILRFLAGDGEDSRRMREAVDVWVCPFVDLDGVVNGDYGKDALPWDFNRAWEQMPMRPAVQAIQRDLERFANLTAPRLVIDLHAPGHSTPGLYLQLPREQRPPEQQQAAASFATELARHFTELEPDALARQTTYRSRWNMLSTVASWVWDHLGQTTCVCIETSYQRLTQDLLFPDDYRDIGRRIALAAEAWLARRTAD